MARSGLVEEMACWGDRLGVTSCAKGYVHCMGGGPAVDGLRACLLRWANVGNKLGMQACFRLFVGPGQQAWPFAGLGPGCCCWTLPWWVKKERGPMGLARFE